MIGQAFSAIAIQAEQIIVKALKLTMNEQSKKGIQNIAS